ncbi:hypothetical protein FQI32_16240 [Escherichia coli]|nr:hypothetical protein [Escherichia coli]PSS39827.1 hypothetical protein BEM40_014660 [Escherichia sp. MOD1-EC5451]PSY67437.1 hypothetical protein C7B16_04930 [Escherichia sp. 20412-1]EFA4952931.1 hypothetical protein [Escherichia coli]EFA5034826.1 hypothetical protein [Escherichia coli]
MRCVITTRSNLFGFKQNGQGGDTLPIFLPNVMLAHLIQPACAERMCRHDKLAHRAMAPDATTISHPLTP